MNGKWFHLIWELGVKGISIVISCSSFWIRFAAIAQPPTLSIEVVPDGSLGVNSSQIRSQDAQNRTLTVQGGLQQGDNVFHSFEQFSITEGQTVIFPPMMQENIFTRVTGTQASSLEGNLEVEGNANFFLLNPNGIFFGPAASVDLNGAFVASTAASYVFDSGSFSAVDPQEPPLLTISDSIGFQFGNTPQPIQLNRANLRLPDDRPFALLGGEVDLNGAMVRTPGGRAGVGGLSAAGIVTLNFGPIPLTDFLTFPEGIERADIFLQGMSNLDLFGEGDGEATLFARNLVLEGSTIETGISANMGLQGARAGDIRINATGDVRLIDDAIVRNEPRENSIGGGGNIFIVAENLTVQNSLITTDTFNTTGDAGTIEITVSNQVLVEASGTPSQAPRISSTNQDGTQGNAGEVRITADTVVTRRGGSIFVESRGAGDAGDILINARDVMLDDSDTPFTRSGGLFSTIEGTSLLPSTGGDIIINTEQLTVRNGALVSADILGNGLGGNIVVNAIDTVTLSGRGSERFATQLTAAIREGGSGTGGDITVRANTLTIENGADITVSTEGTGNGGKLVVEADQVELQGTFDGIPSRILAQVDESGVGRGGNVEIETARLTVSDGGQISATTLGQGNAGNIEIIATDSINLNGSTPILTTALAAMLDFNEDGPSGTIPSGMFSTVLPGARGNGGDIVASTQTLTMEDGAQIAANTDGAGRAGDITLVVAAQATLSGENTSLQVNTFGTDPGGDISGGDIFLQAQNLSLSDRAQIVGDTSGSGNAGDIDLVVTEQVMLKGRGTSISADTEPGSTGQGGTITIDSQLISLVDGAGIEVGSEGFGQGGNLELVADDLILENSFISAVTSGSQGGNVVLTIQDFIILLDNGFISTEAGTAEAGGNGGDITIDGELILAQGNSDIIANAFTGNGGNITIVTSGLFGFTLANTNTPFTNTTNDITASSQFGVSSIPNVSTTIDPSQGLTPLATNLVDLSQLIAQDLCATNAANSFTVTGRGGLLPSSREALSLQATWEDSSWLHRTPISHVLRPHTQAKAPTIEQYEISQQPSYQNVNASSVNRFGNNGEPPGQSGDRMVEAQGWGRDSQGNVILMARSIGVSPSPVQAQVMGCN